MRTAKIERNTLETRIEVELNVDGTGKYEIDTGIGFLDHMLTLFAVHGLFDLKIKCKGDLGVDFHHTTEDAAIALSQAFRKAAGDKKGITRFANAFIPMDEALVLCAIDLSGRAYPVYALEIPSQKVGDFDTELVREFFVAFANNFPMALHLRQFSGVNSHHIIEGAFKAFARALGEALSPDEKRSGQIPSSKGVI